LRTDNCGYYKRQHLYPSIPVTQWVFTTGVSSKHNITMLPVPHLKGHSSQNGDPRFTVQSDACVDWSDTKGWFSYSTGCGNVSISSRTDVLSPTDKTSQIVTINFRGLKTVKVTTATRQSPGSHALRHGTPHFIVYLTRSETVNSLSLIIKPPLDTRREGITVCGILYAKVKWQK